MRRHWFVSAIVLVAAGSLVGFLALAYGPWNRAATSPPERVTRPGARDDVMGGGGVGAAANYRVHCAACHGIGGRGDGWRARVSRLRMEDLTDSASMTALPDEYLFQVIKHGGANLGKPGMPSWGQALTDEEIRDLVAYIRALAPPVRQPESSGAAR